MNIKENVIRLFNEYRDLDPKNNVFTPENVEEMASNYVAYAIGHGANNDAASMALFISEYIRNTTINNGDKI